ncbi:MAG: Gfo/Idh/MocA family protein, partial [Phycisphaeraceae bacterium]
MTTRLHWGILGTGNIANQFAEGATHARRSKIVAVGSRTQRNASDFAERFEIAHAHGSYEALLADDGVEAVYISLPNSLHHEWTLKALAAGKHVLCEKPFASNEQQAREMFAAAERADRRLVEAFMYRSHPLTRAVIEKVRQGAIGNLKLVRTSFCYRTRHIEDNIRFDPALDGGALMDVGCYCLDFSCLLAGEAPESAEASAHIHPTGVDDYVAGSMKFPSGVLASFCCGMSVQTNNAAIISGD